MPKTILVTGAAGFIGSHTAETFLKRGDRVVGLDNFNSYYDPSRKRANVAEVQDAVGQSGGERFTMIEGDIRDEACVADVFRAHQFDAVVHLAAMAGVRVSIDDPGLYYDVNVNGTLRLLDACVGRLSGMTPPPTMPAMVFASTSSVYGATEVIPFVPEDRCDRPLAPYASSKRASEMLGYAYHHLYKMNVTVLRFFTVYGPRGRPDMMAYKVFDNIFKGMDVPLYNSGNMHRDWTYVEDIVSGIVGAVDHPQGYDILNLGRGEPVLLADFVKLIERLAGREAKLTPTPMLSADIAYTFADISKTTRLLGYAPTVSVADGVERFWQWYQRVILPSS